MSGCMTGDVLGGGGELLTVVRGRGPSSSRHVSSIEVRLDVIAKPVSLVRSGMKTTREFGRPLCAWPSWPSGSQVRTRCQTSSTSSSASAVVARLSGLLPDRPKDTIRVGVCGSR